MVGLSGITVQFGSIQLTGMVLACVVGMLMGLMFYIFDRLNLTNDRKIRRYLIKYRGCFSSQIHDLRRFVPALIFS